MKEIRNTNKKRVGDISHDGKIFQIMIQGYSTTITANPDGTLNVIHHDRKATA